MGVKLVGALRIITCETCDVVESINLAGVSIGDTFPKLKWVKPSRAWYGRRYCFRCAQRLHYGPFRKSKK